MNVSASRRGNVPIVHAHVDDRFANVDGSLHNDPSVVSKTRRDVKYRECYRKLRAHVSVPPTTKPPNEASLVSSCYRRSQASGRHQLASEYPLSPGSASAKHERIRMTALTTATGRLAEGSVPSGTTTLIERPARDCEPEPPRGQPRN